MTPSEREWKIELNTFRFEPPDVLWGVLRGEITREGTVRLVALYQELGTSRPFFLVCDMKEAELLDEECRRYISEHLRMEWVHGIIYIGARLGQKALARGLVLAAQLTLEDDADVDMDAYSLEKVHFVATRDDALELLSRLRDRLRGA